MTKITIQKTPEDFNDRKMGWAAGIIDSNKGFVDPFIPSIRVRIAHKRTIFALADYFGRGSIENTLTKRLGLDRWVWEVQGEDAKFVAAIIRPCAVTKAELLDRLLGM